MRKDRAAKGKEAAEVRRQSRLQHVWQLRQEVDAFEDALLALEQEVQHEFDERAEELDSYDEAVMTEIQEKVGGETATMSVDRAADPLIEKHRKETEEVWARVRKAEQELENAKQEAAAKAHQGAQQAEAAEAAEAAEEATRQEEAKKKAAWEQIELDPEKVPLFNLAKDMPEQQAAALDYAYQVIQQVRWMTDVQVSFRILALKTSDIQLLIGDQWSAVYENEPKETDIVHPQVLRLLATSLEKISAQYLAAFDAEVRTKAKAEARRLLKAEQEEAAKRRKQA